MLPGETNKHESLQLFPNQRQYVLAYAKRNKCLAELEDRENSIGSYRIIKEAINCGPYGSLRNSVYANLLKNLDIFPSYKPIYELWSFLISSDPMNSDGTMDEARMSVHTKCQKFMIDVQPRLSSLKKAAISCNKHLTTHKTPYVTGEKAEKLYKFYRKAKEVCALFVETFGIPNFLYICELTPRWTEAGESVECTKMLSMFPLLSEDQSLVFIRMEGGEYLYCILLLAFVMPYIARRYIYPGPRFNVTDLQYRTMDGGVRDPLAYFL